MLFKQATLLVSALAALEPFAAAQSHVPVVGPKVDAGGSAVPLRKNINDLQSAGGPEWDLYIRALATMYKDTYTDTTSFFQIAGIHGKPYIEWNNAGSRKATGWQGYCPHNEQLFLPWHRPLVSLYEQTLVERAKKLALGYPQSVRAKYVKAADNLRSPYWDWSLGQGVPPVTAQKTVTIKIPDGGNGIKDYNVDNPLYTFTYPKDVVNGKYGSFDGSNPRTFRCSSGSYPADANKNLATRPYKRWTYDAFTYAKNFADFASTGSSTGVSLEQIHNGIHYDAACKHEFLDTSLSAFDPLFFLHHTHVDRLWAYWQAIKPQSADFDGSYQGASRYQSAGGTTINPGSALHPFFQSSGAFHTSQSVHSIKNFKYSYEGLEYWQKSDSQMQKDATKLINKWYSSGNKRRSIGPKMSKRDATSHRYFVQVEYELSELERPCTMDVYVNGKKAGNLVVMAQPDSGMQYNALPLDDETHSTSGTGNSLAIASLLTKLKDNIEIDIMKLDGTHVSADSVKSLKAHIQDAQYTEAESDEKLPVFSNYRSHPGPIRNFIKALTGAVTEIGDDINSAVGSASSSS